MAILTFPYLVMLNFSHPVDLHHLVEISANQQSENQVEPDAESLTADKRIYKLPVLIPARTLPSLHDLALQMVQTGTFQECVRAFKYVYNIFVFVDHSFSI